MQGKQFEEEGCLSLPDIREKVKRAMHVTVRAQDAKGKWFEMDGRRAAGARLSTRNRPPGWNSLHLPRERAEAGSGAQKNPQAAEGRGLVEGATRLLRHAGLRSADAQRCAGGGASSGAGSDAAGQAERPGHAVARPAGEGGGARSRDRGHAAGEDQETIRSCAAGWRASRRMPFWWWPMGGSSRDGCSICRNMGISTCMVRCCRSIAAPRRCNGRWRRGERVTGVTTMRLNEGLDTGDMLLQQELVVEEDQTAEGCLSAAGRDGRRR